MIVDGSARRAAALWLVQPTGLPLIRHRCLRCPSTRYRPHGKFRVNAHRKLLDVWLLALCVECGETIKLTVLERIHVRSMDPVLLDRCHENDPDLAAELLADPGVLRRNNVSLDWDGAWTLQADPVDVSGAEALDVSVRFVQPIPVRPVRLLATGLGLPRAEVDRLIADGTISSACRLGGKASGDFSFTLRL